MLRRLWNFLADSRHLAILCFAALAAVAVFGADSLHAAAFWCIALVVPALLLWGVWRGVGWLRRRRNAGLPDQAATAGAVANPPAGGADAGAPGPASPSDSVAVQALRNSMQDAVAMLRGSRMGKLAGARALYELPWCLVIGSPGAGKSCAIRHSGLPFPYEAGHMAPAPGGTTQLDWYFAREGILLDTAGRYAMDDGSRDEWRALLDLLKKHRARAPVNGVVVTVSVDVLRGDPETALQLARCLRLRMQDMVERLEVFTPVYVLFTKADHIAGFSEFFAQADHGERERAWGATMPYKRRAAVREVLAFFDHAYDGLVEGIKELGVAILAQPRSGAPEPGVLAFPLEFTALRATARAFIAALFEENPFQDGLVFRGFYFSSALRDGVPASAQSRRIAERFALAWQEPPPGPQALPDGEAGAKRGYFLLQLFRDVIFADRALVTHYASRNAMRLRYAAFAVALLALGALLAGWTWSYQANLRLVALVQADLEQAQRLQAGRHDLQSRLEALELLENRITQLERLRRERPWETGLGLYQGDALERKLRGEYFNGARDVMLLPVAVSLEAQLAALGTEDNSMAGNSADDGYNALKTYLMLAEPARVESAHLNDQLARHWRSWLESRQGAMPREHMIRSAERLLAFYTAHADDPAWPRIAPRLALVEQARLALRGAVRGMPARERVYAAIRARAGTRYPAVTVAHIVGADDQALLAGSHAVPGAYTRDAWRQYVDAAIRDAANGELQSRDWVLKADSRDDLSQEGSPEQVRKALVERYQADYIEHWRKFLQGVSVAELQGVAGAAAAMQRLGDPQLSPLLKVLSMAHQQTAWDAPARASGDGGWGAWLAGEARRRAAALSGSPPLPSASSPGVTGADVDGAVAPGVIARELSLLARQFNAQGDGAPPVQGYMAALSKLRARLILMKNQGDAGPAAHLLMRQTLEGSGSELADALRHIDEQMLAGASPAQQQLLRPLLVRPLMQVFAALVGPAEAEINQTWQVQVAQPFNRSLAGKYPFAPAARVEAASAEIAEFFGPSGVIAKFVTATIGPLAVRRGDVLAPRTWADMGITLTPQAVAQLPAWIAPPGAGGMGQGAAQTVFQLMPLAAPDALEYTVEIDGQQLRHKMPALPSSASASVSASTATAMAPPQWHGMVHPGPGGGVPGARITALAKDGRAVELFNEAGQFGLKRMIDAAQRQRKDGGVHTLQWSAGGVTVALDLKVVSSPEAGADANRQGFYGLKLPQQVVGREPDAAVAVTVAPAIKP
ncbi:MAG: type VI secretion system membrane subunit TssM [Burkholderiaceae bacterium]|nr:type VI secretion system membrane subunit TssM [Burkholderiaceae bacterium]